MTVALTLVVLSMTVWASGPATASIAARAGNVTQVLHLVAVDDHHKTVRKGTIGYEWFERFKLIDDNGVRIGLAYQHCVNTWDEGSMCDYDLRFDDVDPWDQITLTGLFSSLDNNTHTVAITGGTGRYRNVTGDAVWQFFHIKPDKAKVAITMRGVSS